MKFAENQRFHFHSFHHQVGTNGYTAPEILKGEHYGTPADVFSFAIVMCELLTLRSPYSDIMKGNGGGSKDGGELMSWDQVVALTHKDDVKEMRAFFRSVHDLVWLFRSPSLDEEHALLDG